MARERIVITGMGVCTPFGGLAKSWQALCNGTSAIRTVQELVDEKLACTIGGFIPQLPDIASIYPDVARWMTEQDVARKIDRSTHFGLAAVADLLANYPAPANFVEYADSVGVVCGPSFCGQRSNEEGHIHFLAGRRKREQVHRVVAAIADAMSGWLPIYLRCHGPSFPTMTACGTGASNAVTACQQIALGEAVEMFCGGFEHLTPYVVQGFIAPKAITTRFNDSPQTASRPFDRDRSGFVPAEGAGMLRISSLTHALATGQKPLAEIAGWAQTTDGYHMTKGDYRWQARAQRLALERATITPNMIDLVCAHATSTPLGDREEATAIREVFGSSRPLITAPKSVFGHPFGAAGAQELIWTAMSIMNGVVPGIINLTNPDPACLPDELNFCTATCERPIKWAINENFGFGGKNVASAVKAYEP